MKCATLTSSLQARRRLYFFCFPFPSRYLYKWTASRYPCTDCGEQDEWCMARCPQFREYTQRLKQLGQLY